MNPQSEVGRARDERGAAHGAPGWGWGLAVAAAVAFVVSAVFPITAGLAKHPAVLPGWWGAVDVGVAFALSVLGFAVQAVGRPRVDGRTQELTYRVYRVLLHGLFALLVVFFLAGDRIVWAQCLTGFGWRAWLLAYLLPEWLALVFRSPQPAGTWGGRHAPSDFGP